MGKTALLSVSDKSGLAGFARSLVKLGFTLVSTGGTQRALESEGLAPLPVTDLTGFAEMMDGRVKTLHPAVHAGILARRADSGHLRQLAEAGFRAIDLVAVNLYPFEKTIAREGCSFDEAVENIDIGGPAMIRAAAKNHESVVVVVDPADYDPIIDEMRRTGEVSPQTRVMLARKAFARTSAYDAAIAAYFSGSEPLQEALPEVFSITMHRKLGLRYGENPHQRAAFYAHPSQEGPSLATARQVCGKELSYNNINDADAALRLVLEFSDPAAVAVKHAVPCGVALGESPAEAFRSAHAADPVSIFGGIVAFNRTVDAETAGLLDGVFLEVVLAPGYTAEALEILTRKKNRRILEVSGAACRAHDGLELRSVRGGLLVQTADAAEDDPAAWRLVTDAAATGRQLSDLVFACKVAKYVRSNAVVLASGRATVGIGGGQTNRIDAARIAIRAAGGRSRGAVMASDGFFPFGDVVKEAAEAGVAAIAQPGGSIRDDESVAAANEAGLAMYFTGLRHFRH